MKECQTCREVMAEADIFCPRCGIRPTDDTTPTIPETANTDGQIRIIRAQLWADMSKATPEAHSHYRRDLQVERAANDADCAVMRFDKAMLGDADE